MARWVVTLAALGLFAALGGWVVSAPRGLDPAVERALAEHSADPARGETVFWMGGCAGCHSAPGTRVTDPAETWQVLSGGRRFESDFGTFVAPNISPHPDAGIGRWDLNDFARALLDGTSPDGRHYYPAFPYASYAGITTGDVADLWAYWQSLPADATPSQPHDVGFPFSMTRGIGLWKRLYIAERPPSPQSNDPAVERGHYLVETLGHCGECHRPRDALGGQDRTQGLTGAANPAGDGRTPSLPPEGWTAQDIMLYLGSGFTPSFDVAGGAMAEVVASYRNVPEQERAAIAAYLVTLRSSPNR